MKKTFLIFGIAFLSGSLCATSLKVSPGGFIIQNVKPGVIYNLYETTKIKLSIFNDDDTTHTYAFSMHKPSEVGRWEKGYLEIPDSSWCWFKEKEVTIGPQKVGYGDLSFKIPDKACYYNQHWVATMGIIGKQEGGIGLGLGIYVRIQIETESRSDIEERPDGLIGFKPGTIELDGAAPGSSHTKKVTIFNNDAKSHNYSVHYLREDEKLKASSYLTHSYELIPDSSWIATDRKSFKIEPGGNLTLSVTITVPPGMSHYNKKWEEILFIEPDAGLPGFIRVRINTSDKG